MLSLRNPTHNSQWKIMTLSQWRVRRNFNSISLDLLNFLKHLNLKFLRPMKWKSKVWKNYNNCSGKNKHSLNLHSSISCSYWRVWVKVRRNWRKPILRGGLTQWQLWQMTMLILLCWVESIKITLGKGVPMSQLQNDGMKNCKNHLIRKLQAQRSRSLGTSVD